MKIGHVNLRPRLHTGVYILEEFPDDALPTVEFADSLLLTFNGERIRLLAIPGAHDDADIIVHFTGSKIVCTGALSNGLRFPTVDARGGNALHFPAAVKRLLAEVPADVTLIPGHGRATTMAEEKQFHDMIEKTVAVVTAGLAAGKDVATLQQENVLKDWAFIRRGLWDGQRLDSVDRQCGSEGNAEGAGRGAAVLRLQGRGHPAAVTKWHELKADSADVYALDEAQLVVLGYYLLEKERTKEAIALFELYIKEFPTPGTPMTPWVRRNSRTATGSWPVDTMKSRSN